MDIGAWLSRLGLEQYEQSFRDNAVDGEVLVSLTAEDLKDLGVTLVGHRRKLLDAIAALRAEGASRPGEAGEAPGERRQVTVLFADLAGYTALSNQLDAEEVHALLARFFERADHLVEEHGGRVDKHIGDCVMAVFGAPVAHGNESERAVRAALAIRDAMPAVSEAVGHKLGVHVGVAGGEVVASGTGSARHREYTVTGQSVNLASRLTGAAQADEVLIADAVRRELSERLDCEALDPIEVKGFDQPVRAWRLLGLRRTLQQRRPLAGRVAELERFCTALAECRTRGHGRAVHLRGEPGIGKSRLVEAFQAEAAEAGFACHAGVVLDFGTGAGSGAIGGLVLDLLGGGEDPTAPARYGVSDALVRSDEAVFVNDLLGLPQPAELRPLYDAMDNAGRALGRRQLLTSLVERASLIQPRLLVIEDLHWADQPTLALLATLATVVSRAPAILVATSRIDGDPLPPSWWAEASGEAPLTIDLGPLTAAEAHALAGPLIEANAALIERCVERAAGNPLFLEQLLRHAEDGVGAAVPGSVQSLVQARLDRLEPAARTALQAASVLGQRFDLDALDHLLGQPGAVVEPLVAQSLLRPQGDGFLFAHALVRDAVYDSVLKSRRRDLHRRAADWHGTRDAALRAEHLDRAEAPEAARAYLTAATAQLADHRHELALRLVERGLTLAANRADRFASGLLRADILHDLGRMPAALAAYQDALAAASEPAEEARALIGLAAVKRVTDDLEGAFADLDRAQAIAADPGLTVERARIHFLRGNLYFPRGDIEGCLSEHRKSLDLAHEAGAVEQEAAALGGLGDGEYVRGHMISAYDAFQHCVTLCRTRGLRRTEVANRPMMAFTQWFAGDARGARDEALAAIAAAGEVGHRRAQMIAHHAAYFCCHSLSEWGDAWDHAEKSLLLAQELGARRFEPEALVFRASLHHHAGRRPEAEADARQALAIARETGMAFLGPILLGTLALLAEDEAALATIVAEAEALLAAGSIGHNHLLFRRDAIDACLQRGAWSGAEHHAAALEDYARREPSPWTSFVVARGRALAAHGAGGGGGGGGGEQLHSRLADLKQEGARIGHLDALPAIETALAALR